MNIDDQHTETMNYLSKILLILEKQQDKPSKPIVSKIHPTYTELLTGFSILMEYFESIPDDEKPKVDKRLKAVNC